MFFILCSCAQQYEYDYESQNQPTSEPSAVVAVDNDGDGFPHWSTTTNQELADCDDQDPFVTPESERWIPEGNFWRGDDDAPFSGPMREIFVRDYCMDRLEVSNQQYADFMNEMLQQGYTNSDENGNLLYDFDDNDDIYEPTIEAVDDGFRPVSGREEHHRHRHTHHHRHYQHHTHHHCLFYCYYHHCYCSHYFYDYY